MNVKLTLCFVSASITERLLFYKVLEGFILHKLNLKKIIIPIPSIFFCMYIYAMLSSISIESQNLRRHKIMSYFHNFFRKDLKILSFFLF